LGWCGAIIGFPAIQQMMKDEVVSSNAERVRRKEILPLPLAGEGGE
jgi:hypothetical protein